MTQEAFQFVTPSPEMPNAFSFNLIFWSPTQKEYMNMEKLLTERKAPKRSKGGNIEIRSYIKHSKL